MKLIQMIEEEINNSEEDYNVEVRYDHLYKIIIIGDSAVGKTSLLSKYVKGIFPISPLPTVAIEFATKIIQIKEGGYIKAQIWDTAGQEKYKSITSHHYRKAVGALIVYDITKRSSFNNALQWLQDLQNNAEKNCVIALVGNKVDIIDKNNRKREISYQEGKSFAEENHLLFYETSACSNVMVNDCFEDLLQAIYTERRKLCNMPKENTKVLTIRSRQQSVCCKN